MKIWNTSRELIEWIGHHHSPMHTNGVDDIRDATTSLKGIASFNAESFTVASGAVSLVLDDVPVDGETNEPITSNWAYDLTQTTKEPTGFPNITDTSAPTFSSPTITLAKTNGSFDFYIKGVKFTKSANQTVALPNGDANDIGTWYIAFNSSGVLTATKTTSWDIAAADSCPVAVLYFNGTAGRISDERHGTVMDAATHDLLHYTVGSRFESGLTGTFTDPTAIAVALGKIHDEDIEYSIDAQTQCIPFYHSSGVYTFAAAQNSYVVQVSDILQYDNLTDLVDVSNNSYVAYWVFATLDTITPIWIMPGQREDALLKNARDNNKYESLSLGTLPFPEMKLLYRVILRRSGTSETYTETQDLRTVSNLPSGTYVATDHAALTGLLDDDHTQYILHSLADAANDFLIASGADTFAKQTLAQTLTTLGKAAASGLASLNASTKVVEQPASITDHLDDTEHGTDALTTKAPTSNRLYDHDVATTGVHGAGGDTLATDADITTAAAALDYGLSFEGIVTTYTDSTHFKVATLADKGTGFFKPTAGMPYEIYVVEADGGVPESQQTPVVAYTTADGTFQHAAFSGGNLEAGDIVLIIHPLLASLGTKATAAAEGAVTTTDYLMAYLKQLVTLLIAQDVVVDNIHDTDLPAVKSDTAAIITDTEDLQGNVDAMHDTDLPAVKTVVDAITAAGPTNTQMNTAHALLATPAQVATALTNYDPPTRTEATADKDAVIAAIPAMVGTNSAALASVLGALADAAAEGAVTSSDTVMAYVKQLVTAMILVLADSGELQTDWANGGRLDNLLDAIPTTAMRGTDNVVLSGPTKAEMDTGHGLLATEAKQDIIDTNVDDIEADTNELQTDWANGGRLDNLLDTAAAGGGYTHADWKGNFTWDTSAYTTVEQDISTLFSTNLAIATRRRYSVKLDLTTVEADASFVSLYLAVKEKIDGTNYRAIDRKTILKADIGAGAEPGIIIEVPATSENIQITMQMTTATAGDCTIYYAVVKEALE